MQEASVTQRRRIQGRMCRRMSSEQMPEETLKVTKGVTAHVTPFMGGWIALPAMN
ncbi:hypothetical protein [Aliiroseovarius crassostreae]|uniref:hypothetical protein n=1 Tax=Aliiroseovarius crassostreae TaxID=154981 RepID=UPI001C31DD4B|nr:hypothetical protein [Aliiroseovarius crassostreae]